jgi:hypothetical protein
MAPVPIGFVWRFREFFTVGFSRMSSVKMGRKPVRK